ncbi:hypothetical protein SAMN05421819_2885 [Bryocella elongata]|uniref:TIGR04086 family membrane protein n=1 Tax=Bryocella elongata TaxID=863522 RepID=A0A1H6A3E0_9BACT|nr:hypothetical protein [Bryocella elongata]SEG42882.1 hypothetical protein SAMN05421819_2885 [Bryocella elongata]
MLAAIPQALRSVLAVLAGFVAMVALVIVCTLLAMQAMHLKSGHPTPGYLVINATYSLLAAVAGGWIAARLSRYKPLHHALALAMIVAFLSLVMLMKPSLSQSYTYQLAMAIVPPFAVLAGGWLASRQMGPDVAA